MKSSQSKKFNEAKAIVSGPEDRHVTETLKALHRIGPEASHTMGWILDFAQLDLSAMREGDKINLRYEMKAFSSFGLSGSKKSGPGLAHSDPDMNADPFLLGKDLPSLDEIHDFQLLVRDALKGIKENRVVEFEIPNLKLGINKQSQSAKGQILLISPNRSTAFRYYLIQLLAEYAGNIRQCPGCDKNFLASRLNQNYCSSLCQARLAMRLRRNTPQDRFGKPGRPPKLSPTPTGTVQVKTTKGKGKVKFKKSVGKEKSHGKRRR